MSIKKQHLKSRPVCKVTFRLDKAAAHKAESVHLVGDFNDWNHSSHPMKRLRDGGFTLLLELEPQQRYEFRYLIDSTTWENDWEADAYVPSPFVDSENSVLLT